MRRPLQRHGGRREKAMLRRLEEECPGFADAYMSTYTTKHVYYFDTPLLRVASVREKERGKP